MHARHALLAVGLLVLLLLNTRSSALSPERQSGQNTPQATGAARPVTPVPAKAPAGGSAAGGAADLALQPCRLAAHRAACATAVAELAAYGLDIAEASDWSLFGLQRFVEAVERLADAFGGGGQRARRVARFATALRTGPDGTRVGVFWQAMSPPRDGTLVRGGYADNRLYFNPNTLYDASQGWSLAAFWWSFVHELAHLWDERSAPLAADRYSARMRRWLREQAPRGLADEYPTRYADFGGVLEDFADSVAATVTGEAANRAYYGSPRDIFVRAACCEVARCLP